MMICFSLITIIRSAVENTKGKEVSNKLYIFELPQLELSTVQMSLSKIFR